MDDRWPLPLQTGEREFSLPSEIYQIEKLPVDVLRNLGIELLDREGKRVKIVLNSHKKIEKVLTDLFFYAKEYVSGS